MKVLLVAVSHIGSLGWYCQRALKELGCIVQTLDYRKAAYGAKYHPTNRWFILLTLLMKKVGSSYLNRWVGYKLLATAKEIQPDLILVQKGEIISPGTIRRLKGVCHAITAVWHSDSPFDVETSSLAIINSLQFYDYAFVFDPYYVPAMKQAGASKAIYLPLACDPAVHRSLRLSVAEHNRWSSQICFVGNYQGELSRRTHLLSTLTCFGLRIWGNGWKRVSDPKLRQCVAGGPLYGDDMVRAYNAAEIVINVSHRQSVKGVNMRAFEGPACGAFTLTDYLPSIPDLFGSDEIVCYNDYLDARVKIEHYLAHPEEREAVARRGQRRVLNEHTYKHRMQTLLSYVTTAETKYGSVSI